MLIGYARVSTAVQNLDLQSDALTKAGCEKIFSDIVSGSKSEREGLTKALSHLRSSDTLVVWKLDRLGRSLRDLIDNVANLNARGVGFRSLQENIDTTSAGEKLFFHVVGALAEFERDIIRERTAAGLLAARQRGSKGGRPPAMDEKMVRQAKSLLADTTNTIGDVCSTLGVSKATLYRHVPRQAATLAQDLGDARSEATVTEHHSLAQVSKRFPAGVICLLSALRYHGLTTQTPFEVWLAMDRTTRAPRGDFPKLQIVRFTGAAMKSGVERKTIEGVPVQVYGVAKTLVDCFRFRSRIGIDVAMEALRDAWRQKRCTMDEILREANVCRVATTMRPYLEMVAAG